MEKVDSKYLLDYDAYVSERPDEVSPPWAERYRGLMEDADARVYAFIVQYIFM
ncbi:MAG: hypothetical protein LBS32_00350 [Clostridiales Family XIII bacterium]|jgi:hypothetical protein|nr:hypothetical protein [Clostridiales Family XIII bacterium]